MTKSGRCDRDSWSPLSLSRYSGRVTVNRWGRNRAVFGWKAAEPPAPVLRGAGARDGRSWYSHVAPREPPLAEGVIVRGGRRSRPAASRARAREAVGGQGRIVG
jgi:hypothetical protein